MKWKEIKPGSWFLVPLDESSLALGIVAKISQRGVVFGYFFETKVTSFDDTEDIELPEADEKILCGMFSNLGLKSGEWKVLPKKALFKADEWPMPAFARKDDASGIVRVSEYDPVTFRCVKETIGNEKDLEDLPYDRVMGHIAVIKRLRMLIHQSRIADS
jgi:hypothetical protein